VVKSLEERPDNGTVRYLSTSEGGELEPENEEGLEGKVPWEVVEDNAESKGLDKVEKAKNDPIRQPLDVILRSRGLEGLEGQEGGESPTEEVRNGGGERVEGMENEEKRDRADDDVSLGDLGALLKSLQGGVVVELLIELANVVVCLSLGLDVDGMVLNTFSCGHR